MGQVESQTVLPLSRSGGGYAESVRKGKLKSRGQQPQPEGIHPRPRGNALVPKGADRGGEMAPRDVQPDVPAHKAAIDNYFS